MPTVPTPCRADSGTVSVDRAVCLKGTRHTQTCTTERPTDSQRAERHGQPTWLAEKVKTSRRTAKQHPCPKCGADTLVGPDDDDVYTEARVDPQPATLLEETVALLTGRHSYDLDRHNRLWHRSIERILARRNDQPIMLTHTCGDLMERTNHWRENAACTLEQATLFDFPPMLLRDAARAGQLVHQAFTICAACPVRGDCLRDARINRDSGVRGGLLLEEGRPVRLPRLAGAA